MLRRYRYDPSHVVQESKIQLTEDLSYKEEPVEILDRQIKKLRNKEIPIVKVKWSQYSPKEKYMGSGKGHESSIPLSIFCDR